MSEFFLVNDLKFTFLRCIDYKKIINTNCTHFFRIDKYKNILKLNFNLQVYSRGFRLFSEIFFYDPKTN